MDGRGVLTEIKERDEAWSQRLVVWGNGRFPRAVPWLVARTGDSWLWLALAGWLAWQQQPIGWALLRVVVITAVIVFTTKAIFRRQRPQKQTISIGADKYAFPSGHAARAGAVAITLATFWPTWLPLLLLWSLLVSFARILLSRHFLTDVCGGLMLGYLVALILQSL